MRHERATEELKELAALYALGCLTQHEAHSFETHIKEGCFVCEAELRNCRSAVAGIGLGVNEAPAPEYIRDLLSARIEREPKKKPDPAPAPGPAGKEEPPRPARPAAPAFAAIAAAGDKGPNLLPWVLTATMALAVLIAIYAWNSGRNANAQLQQQLSAAQTDAENLKILFDSREVRAARYDEIARMAGKPGLKASRLIDQSASKEFSALVLWDTEEGQCLFLGELPPAPEGKTYQLWFFSIAAKVPVRLLEAERTGQTFVKAPVPPEAMNATAAVVTLEPAGGSTVPTQPYSAAGRIE